ncbi:M24 family metallopeptidase [Enterococcus faecalis]|nr:M24 family metallopeptidase [Enterococcus faecalis]
MKRKINYTHIAEPTVFENVFPTYLTNETMMARKQKVLQRMETEKFDQLVFYADKEHGSNFEYLTGFIPRFEEGLLVLNKDGAATLILGNENLKLCQHARISADLIHYPAFSLPNQPMAGEQKLSQIFETLLDETAQKIGIVGWKMFTTQQQEPATMFDVPHFIVEALKKALPKEARLLNGTHLLIGAKGARTTNNANELAHYEYGANLASRSMLKALNAIEVGQRETDIGALLNDEGQTPTVVTIAATGQRFEYANMYPTAKEIQLGDALSLTTGYKGGLSSRTGFVIENEQQLPEAQRDYLERVAKSYFQAVVHWLETIRIGLLGREMYQAIEEQLPKEIYHWHLNPGHLVSDDEWMSSPIYPDSAIRLESGMLFQVDIIPSVPGYTGVSAEECVALADETLQKEIRQTYPDMWQRIATRRAYLKETLKIDLPTEVLPMSNLVGYLRPFYLAKDKALCVEKPALK